QDLAGHFVESIEPVRSGFIRTEYPEVLRFQVQLHDVAQESTEHPGCFRQLRTRLRNLHRVVTKVRHQQILEQQTAVSVRVSAHPPISLRREFGKFAAKFTSLVEKFLGTITLHP